MSGVAAGRLRHKVDIQAPVQTQDPNTGEILESWLTIASVWAAVESLSMREFLAAQAEQSEVRAKITIRYRENVDATMRIVYRGKWYTVFGVIPDSDSMLEHQVLMVGEGVRVV